MAYQVTIRFNDTKGITVGDGQVTIRDYTNYVSNGVDSHQIDAGNSWYYKYILTDPDGVEVEFTTLTNPDSADSPVENILTYGSDGIYTVKLISVPEWDNTFGYEPGQCVYDNGALYLCIATTSPGAAAPASSPFDWDPSVTDATLESEYYTEETLVLNGEMRSAYAEYIKEAVGDQVAEFQFDPTVNSNAVNAMKLWLAIRGIEYHEGYESWEIIRTIMTHSNKYYGS